MSPGMVPGRVRTQDKVTTVEIRPMSEVGEEHQGVVIRARAQVEEDKDDGTSWELGKGGQARRFGRLSLGIPLRWTFAVISGWIAKTVAMSFPVVWDFMLFALQSGGIIWIENRT